MDTKVAKNVRLRHDQIIELERIIENNPEVDVSKLIRLAVDIMLKSSIRDSIGGNYPNKIIMLR